MENKLKMGSYSLERKQDTCCMAVVLAVVVVVLFVCLRKFRWYVSECGLIWWRRSCVVGVVCCRFLDFIFEVWFCFFVFSSCCVFVKFSRGFYEFLELNLEIESFGETHTHTSNSMILGFCCFCFSVRQSDPGYGIFESVLICIPCTY